MIIGSALILEESPIQTKVQTRHRGQLMSNGLLSVSFVRAFGDAFEYAQAAALFLFL